MINEVAERLHELSLDTAFPLSLPEMDDIVDAQEAMLIHIPPVFREYLLNSSDAIYGNLEPVTVADSNSHTYLPEVAAEAWSAGMPRDLLPLCQIEDNYYCIGSDDTIYLWNADSDALEELLESVWYWVNDIWLGEEA